MVKAGSGAVEGLALALWYGGEGEALFSVSAEAKGSGKGWMSQSAVVCLPSWKEYKSREKMGKQTGLVFLTY